MKILHISTYDYGGAGLACLRIHKELNKNGCDSNVLVLENRNNEDGVYKFSSSKKPKVIRWFIKLLKIVLVKLKIPYSKYHLFKFKIEKLQKKHPVIFNSPLSENHILTNNLVQEADIIHLHWISKFINYPSFFSSMKKPIVWTIHDLNIFYGGFHYTEERKKYLKYYKTLEKKFEKIKIHSIVPKNKLAFVAISKEMHELAKAHNITKNKKLYLINNPVDTAIFKPYNKDLSKEIFNLSKEKIVIGFVSSFLSDRNKGFKELIEALEVLKNPNIIVLAIGKKDIDIKTFVDINYKGAIKDEKLMALAYSAFDYLIMPSFQEGFAQVPIESMACGTPVVTFPFSGTNELINDLNGIRTPDFSVSSLIQSISKALNHNYNRKQIHEDIKNRFGSDIIIHKYLDVYNELI